MADITRTAPKTETVFIGRAWKNVAKSGKNPGMEFISLKIDKGMELSLKEGDQIALFPNSKREGKQDADYRASIRILAKA